MAYSFSSSFPRFIVLRENESIAKKGFYQLFSSTVLVSESIVRCVEISDNCRINYFQIRRPQNIEVDYRISVWFESIFSILFSHPIQEHCVRSHCLFCLSDLFQSGYLQQISYEKSWSSWCYRNILISIESSSRWFFEVLECYHKHRKKKNNTQCL